MMRSERIYTIIFLLVMVMPGCSEAGQKAIETQVAVVKETGVAFAQTEAVKAKETAAAKVATEGAGAFATLAAIPEATKAANAFATLAALSNKPQIKIGLDPGHGWQGDSGAVGNGLQEKDVTLDIAVRTKAILEENGFQVVMTRTGDGTEHALAHAAKVVNEQNPAIVVSIHTNGSDDNTATGTEACYTMGKSTDAESKALAQLLTDSIAAKFSLKNRGIFPENSDSRCARKKSTGWNQLYIHNMNPPSVIIETAFISNPFDADLLKNRSQDFAQTIADVIINYAESQ